MDEVQQALGTEDGNNLLFALKAARDTPQMQNMVERMIAANLNLAGSGCLYWGTISRTAPGSRWQPPPPDPARR